LVPRKHLSACRRQAVWHPFSWHLR